MNIIELFRDLMRGLRAVVIQPYTEANVKNGLQFYLRRAFRGPSVPGSTAGAFSATGQKRYIYVQVGDSPIIVKDRVVKFIGEEFALSLYNATGQAPPSQLEGSIAIVNYRSDGGAKPTVVTANEVLTANVGNLGTPIGDPEYYFGSTAAGQRNPDSILEGRERILPANSAFYIELELTAGTVGRFEYFIDWYQGAPDLPRKEFT